MALESASFINQLIATNPDGSDPKGQGDDHLRLIKKVLKGTFPQFTGALTGTQDQYNAVLGEGVTMKPGMIVLFSGALASIPAGWLLCNGSGTLSNGGPVPDLRNRFVVGSGLTYAHLSVGGTLTHNHAITVAGTALTIEQIPSHTHDTNTGGVYTFAGKDLQGVTRAPGKTSATGGGLPHTHTATNVEATHLPPYMALAYIIKN